MANAMMIDLETMGTGMNAAVIQVGYKVFSLGEKHQGVDTNPVGWGEGQWNVDLQSALDLGGVMDGSTVYFWLLQPELARNSVTAPGIPVKEVLAKLSQAYKMYGCETVWSQGTNFDIPILDGYYRRAGIRWTPWKYTAPRDTRTMYDLAYQLAGWGRPNRDTAHTALADCRAQVEDVQSAFAAIRFLREA